MPDRPNVLIIITHDTGRHIGGYGLGVDTPNLDRIAADGVRWRQCFCTAPQCSPSRASLLTGQMPHTHGLVGLTHRGFRLRDDAPTIPKLLGAAGYTIWLFGHQHEAPEPLTLGYQSWVKGEPNPYSCRTVTPKVVEFLESAPAQPFLAQVGFTQTHRKFTSSGDAPLDEVVVPPYLPDTPETRRDFRDLMVDVELVDQSVGEILDALERTGLADDTLVIYTTDHGVAFPGAKGTLFDPGLGIACQMRGPGGFAGGRDLSALISNVDLLPTVCEVCGVDVPDEVQGRSLLPIVTGQADEVHEEVFCELTWHAAYDPMRGVRTKTHKYLRSYEYRSYWFGPNVDDGLSKQLMASSWQFRQVRPRELLFDLVHDPYETHNLARDPACAEVLEDLRARVDRFMEQTGDELVTGHYTLPQGAIVTPPTNFEPPEKPE